MASRGGGGRRRVFRGRRWRRWEEEVEIGGGECLGGGDGVVEGMGSRGGDGRRRRRRR